MSGEALRGRSGDTYGRSFGRSLDQGMRDRPHTAQEDEDEDERATRGWGTVGDKGSDKGKRHPRPDGRGFGRCPDLTCARSAVSGRLSHGIAYVRPGLSAVRVAEARAAVGGTPPCRPRMCTPRTVRTSAYGPPSKAEIGLDQGFCGPGECVSG